MHKAVFLDRDGTINVEKNYLYKVEDWEWIPGAKESIALLNQSRYLVVVVSNQSGISRGFYTVEDVILLHKFVDNDALKSKAKIEAFYICPHHPSYGDKISCSCRKPKPGLLFRAAKDLNIDLSKSWFIGDKYIDLLAAEAAGVLGILVKTGHGKSEELPKKYLACDSIAEAVVHILQFSKKS